MDKNENKIERILDEMAETLGTWECWENATDDCTCQTCQFRVTYFKMVEIANEEATG